MAVHYRVEKNPLTKSTSFRLRFLPQGTGGYDEVAARVALKNPGSSAEQIKTHLRSAMEEIKAMLLEGLQVTLEDTMIFRPAFHARLDTPDASLPPMEELLGINISASQPYVKDFQAEAALAREEWTEKAPAIQAAADTATGLSNVLNPDGVLRLTGSNLSFDWQDPDCSCVLAGTESGSTVQTQFAGISDSQVTLVPHIPAQSNPWNNEYTVSITTRYTEHGSVRTGTYSGKLRTPLAVPSLSLPIPPETGILTGKEASPHVSILGGSVAGDETLRIQAVFDARADVLLLSLLGMEQDGAAGAAVPVTADGGQTLPGFSGSAVSSLDIRVNNYAALKEMVRSRYSGRVVDILQIET